MPRLTLRAKLLASFVVILLPVLGLLVYGYREADERHVGTILNDQMRTAQAVAAVVDASFDEAMAVDWALTNDPVVQTNDEFQMYPHLQRLAAYYPQYEGIAVFDRNGDNVGGSVPPRPRSERIQVSDRPWFQRLMATEQPVVSEVIISPRTSAPTIVIAVPRRDEGGRVVAMVMAAIYLESLSRKLAGVALSPEQGILLVDKTGTAALYTALPELPWEQRNLSEFEPVQAALDGTSTAVGRFVSPLTGATSIGAFTPTPKYGWVVGVTMREDVALAPVRAALRDQMLGFGVIALLSMALVFLFSHALLGPVRHLTDQAQALGRGDLTRRVDIRTGDEMEKLGHTFNQMADRLARTLTNLRAVLDATESGILMYDRDLVIRLVNRRMTEWFGLDPTQVIGQSVSAVARDHISPTLADPSGFLARLDRLIEHPDETFLEEVQTVGPDYRVFRLYFGPVRADDERIGHLEVYTDITELRWREEERQALGQVAEALVREQTLNRVADVVVEQVQRVLRAHSVTLFLAHPQREELHLIAHRGLSAVTVDELGIVPFSATLLSALAARTGQLQTVCDITTLGPELALARRMAEREGLRSLFSQPLVARGRLVGVVTLAKPVHHHLTQWEHEFLRSFADLCAVAVENARLYDEIRQTLHLHEEFLSAAAHELKTPIGPLRGFTQLLLRSKAARPPEERQALEVIERQTRRITRLAEDLLETVRPSTRPLELRTVDLAVLAEEVVLEAQRASERHRVILCRPSPVLVSADAELVRRVLLTLLDNAMRFSPQGGRIEVNVTAQEAMAQVSIRDYGLGIQTERQRYVFEPFYEPFPAGTPGYYGATGLGLYVVKTIVERHGGRMWFESEEGKGSTFFFTLPLHDHGART